MANLFERILVPYDDSKNSLRALNKAIVLANVIGAKLTIVHVINYQKSIAKIVEPYPESLVEYVTKFLSKAVHYAARMEVEAFDKILYGSPSEEILNFMKKNKFDLVVVGKRGTSKFTGEYLGSVSNALVQNSKVPVLVVQ
jgi:nucleotide-binding universal stress UspA family protein